MFNKEGYNSTLIGLGLYNKGTIVLLNKIVKLQVIRKYRECF